MKILKIIFFIFFGIFSAQKNVDLIVHHAKIYTVDSKFSVAEAIAISKGKIVAIGSEKIILKKYQSKNKLNLNGKTIFPGFIDAHAHFYGYGSSLQNANLRNTKSWDEIVEILKEFAKTHPEGWLLGRGWDQNDWENKEFPTKEKLDELFPNRPVYLTRIDGHAAIVNQTALDLAKFDEKTTITGGDLLKNNGKLTGVLIDNAKDKMAEIFPSHSENPKKQILQDAEKNCFEVGLTSIFDAGLDYELVQKINELQNSNQLKMRLNVMLSDSQKNIDWIIKNGKVKTPRLQVNSFKLYGDGALGSRGACLLEDYSDKKGQKGFLLSEIGHFKKMAKILFDNNLQMNTHAIGDSANRVLLKVYADILKGKNDRRWRIEHAQVLSPKDFDLFSKYSIIPSVQPTHATSDMYWAEERLGKNRIKAAYAYQDLLKQNGWLPLGTDFPIEEINPILTFYAAVARKDTKGYPENGFQKENALTREQAIKGMTIWAAKGSFLEKEIGSLEVGKYADFVVLTNDLMAVSENKILETKVLHTYVNGEKVYEN